MPISSLSTIFRNYASCGTILAVAALNLLVCAIPFCLLFYSKLADEWKELLGFFVGVYMLTGGVFYVPCSVLDGIEDLKHFLFAWLRRKLAWEEVGD
jgi:hypothetical protein